MYKVMLVDDNEAIRLWVKRFKIWNEKTGFQLQDEAGNGKEALEKLGKQDIDLIITDIRMPIIDGMELLQKIVERQLDVCVIFLSEYSEFEYARKGLVLGAFDYLIKPVKEGELITTLARVKGYLDSKINEGILYPEREVQLLTDKILKGDNSCNVEVEALINTASALINDNKNKRELLLKNVYKNILLKVKNTYPWVDQFIHFDILGEAFDKQSAEHDSKYEIVRKFEDITKFINCFLFLDTGSTMITKICEYVLSEKEEVSLQNISQRLFMNGSYISSTFKEKTGITLSDYLLKVKMERAKKMLMDSEVKTYEVANFLGYKDTEYFSRQFKKYTGVSPSQYKVGHRCE